MKLNNNIGDMKKWITLIIITAVAFWGVNNLNIITGVLSKLFSVLSPFILGGIIAFILNIPTTKIEKFLKSKCEVKNGFARTVSIILSLFMFLLLIIFIAFLLIPELIENIELLMKNIPPLIEKIEVFVLDLLNKYPDIQIKIQELFAETGNIGDIVSNILNYFVNGAIGFITNLVSGFVTVFTALIFAIYMLSQKEYLIRGSKKIVYALLSKKRADDVLDIAILANKTFAKFISGQCVEAVILGGIIFIVSVICRFPYALIIAVLTAVTALVPIFGAIIAMVIGAILIGITNPLQALIFIIVFQVVQQIEGNFIYPRVVGKSVGLSPMWTLLSISVGGSLFGVSGMLLALPTASVIYILIKDKVNAKLKTKKLEID